MRCRSTRRAPRFSTEIAGAMLEVALLAGRFVMSNGARRIAWSLVGAGALLAAQGCSATGGDAGSRDGEISVAREALCSAATVTPTQMTAPAGSVVTLNATATCQMTNPQFE